MRKAVLLGLVLVSACVTPAAAGGVCPAPRLVPMSLVVGDGARDRGFPGGVSLADVDNDGDLDLMATGGYSVATDRPVYRANTLYLNDGSGNFRHSSDPEFLVADNPNSGSTWGDVDHDGDVDAFISVQHGRSDVFLRNVGGGRFARESLGDATSTRGSNFAGSWADMDGDGDLDLMSGGPTLEAPGGPLHVFRNDAGAFVRVTGVSIENGPTSNAGAILWADFDNDGDQDLLVANSDALRVNNLEPTAVETPQYYRNDGGWSFVRVPQAFNDRAYSSTTAARADIDGDGDLDLFLGLYGHGNPGGRDSIFLNDGAGGFSRDARFEGHSHLGKEAGVALFVDLDLDGDVDLLTTADGEGVRLMSNDGSGVFTLVDDQALLGRAGHYWGGGSGDIDGDGDHDVALGSWSSSAEGEYVTILRNDSERCGAPLRVQLRNQHGTLDPIGARVTITTRGPHGERRQHREASGQSTFRGQSGNEFLFGVLHGERVVRVDIRWPDGRAQTVRNVGGRSTLDVVEPRSLGQ